MIVNLLAREEEEICAKAHLRKEKYSKRHFN